MTQIIRVCVCKATTNPDLLFRLPALVNLAACLQNAAKKSIFKALELLKIGICASSWIHITSQIGVFGRNSQVQTMPLEVKKESCLLLLARDTTWDANAN
jgi:hypothetical protein